MSLVWQHSDRISLRMSKMKMLDKQSLEKLKTKCRGQVKENMSVLVY